MAKAQRLLAVSLLCPENLPVVTTASPMLALLGLVGTRVESWEPLPLSTSLRPTMTS